MALTAYLLIDTHPEKTLDVVQILRDSKLFKAVDPVRGPCDVIAVAEFPTNRACDD